jgi:hypothetical protein
MRHAPMLLVLSLAVSRGAPIQAQLPDWVGEILNAARLPVVTSQARLEGIPSSDIIGVIDAMKRARVPASEATILFDSTRAAHRDNGPVGNFGAFVQSQLDAGKRGTELAAAIRAEHARVGKGRGAGRGQSDARGGGNAGRGRGASDAGGRARGRSGGNQAADSSGRGASRGRGRPPLFQS